MEQLKMNKHESVTKLPAWRSLEAHSSKVRQLHLRKLFADDVTRGERMSVEAVGIYFDYSKHLITDETLSLLLKLTEESDLSLLHASSLNLRMEQIPNITIIAPQPLLLNAMSDIKNYPVNLKTCTL